MVISEKFHQTFGRFCDLVNKPLQKLLLAELQWIDKRCQTLRTAEVNERLKNPLRSVGCFLSDSIGFSPFGIVPQLIKLALLLRLQLG
jgi:hypothetical protein